MTENPMSNDAIEDQDELSSSVNSLSGKQSRYLRALGHPLKPCLILGKQGVTVNVVKQIQDSLRVHELVKVKLPKIYGPERREMATQVAEATNSALVQVVGRNFLLYLPNQDKPKIKIPKDRS